MYDRLDSAIEIAGDVEAALALQPDVQRLDEAEKVLKLLADKYGDKLL